MKTFYLDCRVCFGIEAESLEEAQKELWLSIINNKAIRNIVPFEDCEIVDIFTIDPPSKKER